MSEVVQFPPESGTATVPAEANQTITLLSGTDTLSKAGSAAFLDISAWKNANFGQASSYTGVVIEFACTATGTLGDGTAAQAIGLYGERTGGGKFLLGLLGINLGGAVPQIPMIVNAAAVVVGFAQITADISLYDKIAVGAVFADLVAAGTLTIKARPIRAKDYIG